MTLPEFTNNRLQRDCEITLFPRSTFNQKIGSIDNKEIKYRSKIYHYLSIVTRVESVYKERNENCRFDLGILLVLLATSSSVTSWLSYNVV